MSTNYDNLGEGTKQAVKKGVKVSPLGNVADYFKMWLNFTGCRHDFARQNDPDSGTERGKWLSLTDSTETVIYLVSSNNPTIGIYLAANAARLKSQVKHSRRSVFDIDTQEGT